MSNVIKFGFNIQVASQVPVYQQFKDQLKAHIRRENLAPGTRLPNIESLAENAGIGVKTAYKGLNELIKERVCFKRPKKGTFVADENKCAITRKKICAIYCRSTKPNFERDNILGSIYRGMQSMASKHQIDICYISGDPVDSLEFYLGNDKMELTGVIILEKDSYEEGIRLAEIFPDIRFVFVNYHFEEFDKTPKNVYGVFNDDFSGAFQAGEYLCGEGHRQMAVLSLNLVEDNYRKRLEGFRLALQESGYQLDSQLRVVEGRMENFSDHNLRRIGYRLTDQAFEGDFHPSALFVVNDVMALGALDYLKEHKLSQEVELFGYDNIYENFSRDNNFSTVGIDFQKMGERAMDFIGGSGHLSLKSMLLNPQMLVRKTTNRSGDIK